MPITRRQHGKGDDDQDAQGRTHQVKAHGRPNHNGHQDEYSGDVIALNTGIQQEYGPA